jgi:1-acyl-sn-glycerol-3-phosphate acyltransferase
MQRYFIEPYRFIPPFRRKLWCRVGRYLIPRYLRRRMQVTRWRFEGQEHLCQSLREGAGVLLTPNHCRWPDPMVMGILGIDLNQYFYYVVSYHLFKLSRAMGWAINRIGGYSILREGADREAIRTSARILANAERPIVLFPEGTWFRQNDRLGPLQEGVALIARQAVRQGKRPIRIHPVAIKYWQLDDVLPALRQRLARLEARLDWQPQDELQLLPRIEKLGSALLAVKEIEQLGQPQPGTIDERVARLVEAIVSTQEKFYQGKVTDGLSLERIRRLRQRLLKRLVELRADPVESTRTRRSLDLLLFAENLRAHSLEYLRERPCAERLVETVQRIEETMTDEIDVPLGRLGAVVAIGPGLDAATVDPLMPQLAAEIQGLLNRLVAQGPPPEWNCPPPMENLR